jgi:hypothetical protein
VKQKKLILSGIICIFLFGVLPVTSALTDTIIIIPNSLMEPYFDPNEMYYGLQGSYSANASMDVFITDINLIAAAESYYMINNSIPDYVIWGKANTSSGSFSIIFPNNSMRYFIVFGNRNGANYVAVQYTVFAVCGEQLNDIPGFEGFILVAILGLIGILLYRKISKNGKSAH